MPAFSIEDERWLEAPTESDGKPITVDIRVNLFRCGGVNTVAQSAFFDIWIVCYWTDSRLESWTAADLPPLLWGPRFNCRNKLADLEEEQTEFALVDEAGRLKRCIKYHGSVHNEMDLKAFPFDVCGVDIEFVTLSLWSTKDGSKKGAMAKGRSYFVRPVSKKGEGKWLLMKFNGAIPEWNPLGITTVLKELPTNANGQDMTSLVVCYHVTRKTSFYFYKVIVPLYLLTALSFFVFFFPDTAEDLPDRINFIATCFLASAAMLYVISAELPKTDFLTPIDKMILFSVSTLLIECVATCLLLLFDESYNHIMLNGAFGGGIFLLYVLGNIGIFLPAQMKGKKHIAELRQKQKMHKDVPAKNANNDNDNQLDSFGFQEKEDAAPKLLNSVVELSTDDLGISL